MANVVLIYSTVDGHTREICERLKSIFVEQEGHRVAIAELTGQLRHIDLRGLRPES